METPSLPPTSDLLSRSTGDEAEAVSAATRFLQSLTPSRYDRRLAWSMLDPWYRAAMGWHSMAQFSRSPEAESRSLNGIETSPRASLLANDRPVQRNFVLARTGITAQTCNRSERRALQGGIWYVTPWPRGGNAPGYVVLAHRSSAFTILHAG